MSQHRAAFRRLAGTHTLIPVTRALFSDLETPVAAFWKLHRGDHGFLLESVEGGEQWGRYTFMGTEPRAVYTVRGRTVRVARGGQTRERREEAPLVGLLRDLRAHRFYRDPALPRFVGGLVGALGYDAVRWFEDLPDRHGGPTSGTDSPPEAVFLETRLVAIWDNVRHRMTLVYLAEVPTPQDADAAWDEAQAALDEAEARLRGPLPPLPSAPPSAAPAPVETSLTDAAFAAQVEAARDYIAAGDVIQVVLSRRFSQPALGLHPFSVYRALRALNPSPYMFYLAAGEATVVGASPEALVRLTGDLVETRPIAGTRPRGATPEEDRAHEASLLADPKERAEHVMLVDLARNDVGRVSEPGTVAVTETMVVERYSHVMHMVSHVQGRTRPDVAAPEVIAATFPAGTLSGAPKVRAMEIIDELEPHRRGFYGGAVGTIGAEGDVDLAITIRSLVAWRGRLDVQAGAGVVYDSVPAREAEETRNKARAVLRAVDLARAGLGRRVDPETGAPSPQASPRGEEEHTS